MLLTLFSALSALLSFIAGMKTKGVLWTYMLTCCLYDSLLFALQTWSANNWLWTRNGFLLLEFTCISVYYNKELFDKRTSFRLFSPALLLFFLLHTTFYNGGLRFNYTGTGILNFYYILLSLAGYQMLLREQKTNFLEKSPFFWANTALIMYASGSLLLCLLQGMTSHPDTPEIGMYTFLSLSILKNILTGIALSRQPGT